MDDLEEKLGRILNNPQMMQNIMAMAQSMGSQEGNKPDSSPNPLPDIDLATIQKISGLAQKSNIDQRERALLRALSAYLSKERIYKLEKAMRAAKIAKIASSALSQRGIPSHAGR